ncbi:hypothetical protein WJ968_20205 [Achromobacter xylosoxidans]
MKRYSGVAVEGESGPPGSGRYVEIERSQITRPALHAFGDSHGEMPGLKAVHRGVADPYRNALLVVLRVNGPLAR